MTTYSNPRTTRPAPVPHPGRPWAGRCAASRTPLGALVIGDTYQQLADYWLATLNEAQPTPALGSMFTASRAPFEKTLDAIEAMLPLKSTGPANA